MSVRVVQIIETVIENTHEGVELADEVEEKLRQQGALIRARKASTNNIIISAEYHMIVHSTNQMNI